MRKQREEFAKKIHYEGNEALKLYDFDLAFLFIREVVCIRFHCSVGIKCETFLVILPAFLLFAFYIVALQTISKLHRIMFRGDNPNFLLSVFDVKCKFAFLCLWSAFEKLWGWPSETLLSISQTKEKKSWLSHIIYKHFID